MALKFNPIASQSQKLPSFVLPPMTSLRSPKFFMVSTLPSGSKIPILRIILIEDSSTHHSKKGQLLSPMGNTARLAKEYGDIKLAQICGNIASDEKRHETAYAKIVEKLFEIDPDGTVLAFADMMRKKITMPAEFIYDGRDDNIFDHFSAVAQRLGVYTAKDYADIVEFLVYRWEVEGLTGLSADGRKAQDYVCGFAIRIRRLVERAQERAKQAPSIPFSWIFDREVKL